ncbi:MAG TPA: 2-oxoacid:acceptor oxidoreductase family protein, partial [Hyphomicrobiaceae bacterium]|nr:2-oxoacid:acceptor oxidoreductase family protein [Hyphomicrobiaceae bacterium]
IAEMCAAKWQDTRQRQLFKNMVYVGALTALLDMDVEVLKGAVADQLKGKEKLVAANMEAVALGRDYASKNFDCPLPIRVRHADGAKGKILVSGNDAAGLGAIYAGATVCAWYPITPSTSLAEAFERHAKRLRITKEGRRLFGIVQAEDELAAIGVAIGGGWNGARAFTATSGPGISLMSEFLGLAYFAEVPVVLFNIQRGGPSTGMPTRTQQSDIISCAYASHGDTKHVLLFPANPTECFAMGAEAFDLAERLQTPVIVMSDLDIGMNEWVTDPFAWNAAHVHDRGKVLSAEQLEKFKELKGKDWGRYQDVDADAIPYRTLPGTHPTKGAFFTRGTSHDENARYTEDGRAHARVLDRIRRKFDTAQTLVPKPEVAIRDTSGKTGLIYFGATTPAVREALDLLEREGVKVNALRIKAFPFTRDVASFCAMHERVFVVEQNRDAQMRSLLMTEAEIPGAKLIPALNYDGMPLTAAFVHGAVMQRLQPAKAAAE